MATAQFLLIDDHDLYRSGLRAALNASMPYAAISEASSIGNAIHNPSGYFDAIILDYKLPGLNGVEGLRLLKKKWPFTPVLMLSSQNDPETVNSALQRGAAEFISKGEPADNIVAAINRILCGQSSSPQTGRSKPFLHLSPRQCEVLDLLCQGLPNKQIAQRMSLSENTVRVHVQAVYNFLQVTSRAEAIIAARNRGIVG